MLLARMKQSGKFKYLGVSFTSEGRQNSELDIRIGKASAVMRQLHRSVVLKRELCTKAKLFIFRSVYDPFLTYDHECWIRNEKERSRVQAAEMGFLGKISGLTLLDKVNKANIRESLNMESLLLRPERSQLRWYRHVTQMYQERTAKKLLCSTPIGPGPASRGILSPPINMLVTSPPIHKLILFMTSAFVLTFHTLTPP